MKPDNLSYLAPRRRGWRGTPPPMSLGDALKTTGWQKKSEHWRENSKRSSRKAGEAETPLTALARSLPRGDRALCPTCMGTGAYGNPFEIGDCSQCRSRLAATDEGYDGGYCDAHRCRTCLGAGVVCPHCSGMRFVRVSRPSGNDVERCPTCCEGNNVSASKEMAAIRAWLARRCPACNAVRPRGQATCDECGEVSPVSAPAPVGISNS